MQEFVVDASGAVSSTGRIYEGPLCIQVFYNPASLFAILETTAGTPLALPDFTKILLGGPGAGGPPVQPLQFDLSGRTALGAPRTLPTVVTQIDKSAQDLKGRLDQLKLTYNAAFQAEGSAIDDLTQMYQAMRRTDKDSFQAAFRSQYGALRLHLKSALDAPKSFTPTDVADAAGNVYLADAQTLEDTLAHLPLEFVTGTVKPNDCTTPADVNWTDWFAKCKDSFYTPLKAELDAVLAEAQSLTSASDAVTSLKKKVNIVVYWDKIFTNIGLTTVTPNPGSAPLSGFYTHTDITCGFSIQTVPSMVNIVTYDYAPTLNGSDPTKAGPTGFVTVNCSTRFTISAGIGFSTIEQKTFAIVKSSDGKGGTINTFGTSSDSQVTPIALAVTHVRIKDWLNHGIGLHGSFGIGGNLQTNANAAYFLPGLSVSLWRTMYLTAGAGIGSTTELAGGFHEGDTVPAGITDINGQTKTHRTAGFSFAITFTKP